MNWDHIKGSALRTCASDDVKVHAWAANPIVYVHCHKETEMRQITIYDFLLNILGILQVVNLKILYRTRHMMMLKMIYTQKNPTFRQI